MAEDKLYADRGRAESFGSVAEEYERYRPSYPAALIDDLVALRPARVLDVGCGTGKAAVLLAARGLPVLGVEVDGQMAGVARGRGIAVEVSAFESWDDAGRRFDLITCGQSWHWVEPAAGVAMAARVLRPGGTIARFWNHHGLDPQVLSAFSEVYRPYAEQATTPGTRKLDRSVPDPFEGHEAFCAVQTRDYRWDQRYTAEQWVRMVSTHSDHLRLPTADRAALQAALYAAIRDLGGTIDVHYGTYLMLAHRAGAR